MAEIIRGKMKGRTCKVRQWCNDWFQIDVDGMPKIVSPTMLRLTGKERNEVLNHKNNGNMMEDFTLLIDGTFKRKRVGA